MTYSLLAIFLASGDVYIERTGLTLQACAGQAAMARQELLPVQEQIEARVGEVRYLCMPERSLARVGTDTHGVGQ